MAALLLVAISSIELYETCKEFSTSEYERSTTSTAENRREKEEYNFRVGVLAAQVLGSKSFSKGRGSNIQNGNLRWIFP